MADQGEVAASVSRGGAGDEALTVLGVPALNDLHRLYGALRVDVEALGGATRDARGMIHFPSSESLSPIARRSLVRGVFAFIEGVTWALKQAALAYHIDSRLGLLTEDEVSVLAERIPRLRDDGTAGSGRLTTRTLPNIRFAIQMFARAYGAEYAVETAGVGWQQLGRSVQVRDRLMHPRRPSDLDVATEEVDDSLGAALWFDLQLKAVMQGAVCALEANLSNLGQNRGGAAGLSPD
ncbi:MAG: hypothetical protein ACYC3F_05250 [Gemmatimonadaceae bacterium]